VREQEEIDILQIARQRVRELSEAIAENEVADDETHVIVIGHATLDEFLQLLEKKANELKTLGCKIALRNGDVIIYEFPASNAHGTAQVVITSQLFNANNALLNNDFVVVGPSTLFVRANGAREPDGSLLPINRNVPPFAQRSNDMGQAYPTLVIEIGVSQTLADLDDYARDYFSTRTTIRLYLVIKLYPLRANGTAPMVALLYVRSNPINRIPSTVISFGTCPLHHMTIATLTNHVQAAAVTGVGYGAGPCNAAGLVPYLIQLPTVELYNGVPGGVPAGHPVTIPVDLFGIQAAVLHVL